MPIVINIEMELLRRYAVDPDSCRGEVISKFLIQINDYLRRNNIGEEDAHI